MSGFVGLATADGAPVDRELLERMTQFLAFRGPDGRGVFAEGSVGLGHTLLRTSDESAHERQPATLDGETWITADARIDRREDLARELGLSLGVLALPDCYLILHAYARWGEGCVEHLIGDFAFAVWDERARKLFAARDHFGIKPLYYAHVQGGLAVSNTLDCIRLHPGVSDALNELAIADFLLFYHNRDPSTTTFADVQRVPPAHALTWAEERLSLLRYWSLPCDGAIRYRRRREYVEHFGALFEQSVRDRTRSGRASIFLSGGMDSTSVAATARRVSPSTALRAYTWTWKPLLPDDEEHYAQMAARHLGIPIQWISSDGSSLYDRPESCPTPEPVYDPQRRLSLSYYRAAAEHAPVVLTGHGGDALFCQRRVLSGAALRQVPTGRLFAGLVAYTLDQRRIPRFRLRGTLRHLAGFDPLPAQFPAFLEPGLVMRHDLQRRYERLSRPTAPLHRWRPDAASVLTGPLWPAYFETADAAWTQAPVEEWHPLFSFSLVQYMMSISEMPFCVDKYLLRAYASGLLPEQIRRRPKVPLCADPVAVLMRETNFRRSSEFRLSHPRLGEFVDVKALTASLPEGDEGNYSYARVYSLNLWLEHYSNGGHRCPIPRVPPVPSIERPR